MPGLTGRVLKLYINIQTPIWKQQFVSPLFMPTETKLTQSDGFRSFLGQWLARRSFRWASVRLVVLTFSAYAASPHMLSLYAQQTSPFSCDLHPHTPLHRFHDLPSHPSLPFLPQ